MEDIRRLLKTVPLPFLVHKYSTHRPTTPRRARR
jgi:hypothetical protein